MRLAILTLAATLAFTALPVGAESLALPGGKGAASYREMPRRGMHMAAVERRFGAPKERLAPVGRPPITRWVYDDYTVYFEHRHVVRSVPHRPAGAAPRSEAQPPVRDTRPEIVIGPRISDDPVIEPGKP